VNPRIYEYIFSPGDIVAESWTLPESGNIKREEVLRVLIIDKRDRWCDMNDIYYVEYQTRVVFAHPDRLPLHPEGRDFKPGDTWVLTSWEEDNVKKWNNDWRSWEVLLESGLSWEGE